MGTVTENMKIFLVTVLLCLTILAQAWGAPGQHLLIETEDGDDSYEEGEDKPAVGAGGIRRGWGRAASNSHAANHNNIQIGCWDNARKGFDYGRWYKILYTF